MPLNRFQSISVECLYKFLFVKQSLICSIHMRTTYLKWIWCKTLSPDGINTHFVLLGDLLYCMSPFYVAGFIYCRSFGRRCKHSFMPGPTICFSLSSASPAHSPKEEYVITHSGDTPKEETVHDQSEDQQEPQDDKSELTERKSLTGWLAAHHLLYSMK